LGKIKEKTQNKFYTLSELIKEKVPEKKENTLSVLQNTA